MDRSRLLASMIPLAVQAWLGFRSNAAYRSLPEVPLRPSAVLPTPAPTLAVIVPARNEAATLPRLLPSLLRQDYPSFEVLVVDDGSDDGTAAVAEAHGVRVISAGPLPSGWTGKPHACATGAAATHGEWLLFCDADTQHMPHGLRSAMAYVLENGAESLSVFPRQLCETFWEQLLLPYAYQHFFAGVASAAVNDPQRPQSLLNGQYLLIRRDTYERVGGHAAVRGSVVEDVALGRVLKRASVRHQVARGEAIVQVRMYTGLGAIVAGFAKNSFRFLLDEPVRGTLVLASTLLAAAPTPQLLVAGTQRRGWTDVLPPFAGYLIAAVTLMPWQARFGTHRSLALAQPLTAALFQVISLAGIWSSLRGQTRWKGRRY